MRMRAVPHFLLMSPPSPPLAILIGEPGGRTVWRRWRARSHTQSSSGSPMLAQSSALFPT